MQKRIAITGSLKWEDRIKIKQTLFKLKNSNNNEFEVIGGGFKIGADQSIKKFCLEFNIEYREIPPYEYQWNNYCYDSAYKYNKQYKPNLIYIRNERYSKISDALIVFLIDGENSVSIEDLINRFNKKNKKIIAIK